MERYNLDIEVPKEPLHNRQFTFGAVIDQLMGQHDVLPNNFQIMIRDMESAHKDIPEMKPCYQLKMVFNKNQENLIQAGNQ